MEEGKVPPIANTNLILSQPYEQYIIIPSLMDEENILKQSSDMVHIKKKNSKKSSTQLQNNEKQEPTLHDCGMI